MFRKTRLMAISPSGTSVFPSPQKPTFPNSNSTRNQVDKEPLCRCATSLNHYITSINFSYVTQKKWPCFSDLLVGKYVNMLKECHFSMEGTYTSEGPFLSKMVYIKGYGVGPRGGNSKCKTLFSSSSPQNHAYWSQQILTVWYFFMTGKKEAGSEIFSCLLTSNTKITGESL